MPPPTGRDENAACRRTPADDGPWWLRMTRARPCAWPQAAGRARPRRLALCLTFDRAKTCRAPSLRSAGPSRSSWRHPAAPEAEVRETPAFRLPCPRSRARSRRCCLAGAACRIGPPGRCIDPCPFEGDWCATAPAGHVINRTAPWALGLRASSASEMADLDPPRPRDVPGVPQALRLAGRHERRTSGGDPDRAMTIQRTRRRHGGRYGHIGQSRPAVSDCGDRAGHRNGRSCGRSRRAPAERWCMSGARQIHRQAGLPCAVQPVAQRSTRRNPPRLSSRVLEDTWRPWAVSGSGRWCWRRTGRNRPAGLSGPVRGRGCGRPRCRHRGFGILRVEWRTCGSASTTTSMLMIRDPRHPGGMGLLYSPAARRAAPRSGRLRYSSAASPTRRRVTRDPDRGERLIGQSYRAAAAHHCRGRLRRKFPWSSPQRAECRIERPSRLPCIGAISSRRRRGRAALYRRRMRRRHRRFGWAIAGA